MFTNEILVVDGAVLFCQHVSENKVRYKWLDGGVVFIDEIPKVPSVSASVVYVVVYTEGINPCVFILAG